MLRYALKTGLTEGHEPENGVIAEGNRRPVTPEPGLDPGCVSDASEQMG